MSENSKIEWTDHTFNPWIGCTKVSPGCAHCYAETLDRNRYSKTLDGGSKEKPVSHWGPGAARHRTSEATWEVVRRWNAEAARCRVWDDAVWRRAGDTATALTDNGNCVAMGMKREVTNAEWFGLGTSAYRPRVFSASLADWLDEEVPIEWLADFLDVVRVTTNLQWLLLTKRPQNWNRRLVQVMKHLEDRGAGPYHALFEWILGWISSRAIGAPPENVAIGTTVEDQIRANERIPELLKIPALVRFLSCEPLLGPLDLSAIRLPLVGESFETSDVLHHKDELNRGKPRPAIDWIICGGESGQGARPMHPDWARSLRDQCQAAGVGFFFKQWGDWLPGEEHYQGPLWKFQNGELVDSHFFPDFNEEPPGWDYELESCIVYRRLGKNKAGRVLDGREWNEVPEGFQP